MRAQVTSVFHLNCNKKYTETTLIFRPSKSSQKKYIKTTSTFRSSKLHRRKYVETTSIFFPSKFEKVCRNDEEIYGCFFFRRIEVIWCVHWSVTFTKDCKDGSQIWVSQTQGMSREKWLTKISHLDLHKFN